MPQQSPSPSPPFYGLANDSRLRRVSLDADTLQRPHPTRDWATSRVLDNYHSNFSGIPNKSDPDLSHWSFLRPAHPSPEANHALGTPQPGPIHRHLSSVESNRRAPATYPVYSWSPSTTSRDGFSAASDINGQRRFSDSAPAFWQSNPVQRVNFENSSAHPSAWAAHNVYGAVTH